MDIKEVIVSELRNVMVTHSDEIKVAVITKGRCFKCPHCQDWLSGARLIAIDKKLGKFLWCNCGQFYRLPLKNEDCQKENSTL